MVPSYWLSKGFYDAQLLRSQLEGMKKIEELFTRNYKSVTCCYILGVLMILTNARTLSLADCYCQDTNGYKCKAIMSGGR